MVSEGLLSPLSSVTQYLHSVPIKRRGEGPKVNVIVIVRVDYYINYPIILFTDYKTKETKLVSTYNMLD